MENYPPYSGIYRQALFGLFSCFKTLMVIAILRQFFNRRHWHRRMPLADRYSAVWILALGSR